MLLFGEAEIHRNHALGLSREQVLAAYRAEFGADRCIVLPTISFHIDYEVSIREIDGKLVAFVNDPLAAAKIIAKKSIDMLSRLKILDEPTAAADFTLPRHRR